MLVKDRQLLNTEIVYYSHSTETFFFIPFRDESTHYDQIIVGTFVGSGIKFYVMYAIQGEIIDAYEWDGFLVLFSKKNVMLFKPPLDNSTPSLMVIDRESGSIESVKVADITNSGQVTAEITKFGSITLLNNSAVFENGELLTIVP